MGRDFTTAGLITNTVIRAGIPVLDELYKASNLLLLGDACMVDTIIPMMRKWRKHHFRTSSDQTTTAATTYAIPAQAMDRGVLNVTIVPSVGREYSLDPIDLDREIDPFTPGYSLNASSDRPQQYYVHGDRITLYPSSRAGDVLRTHYERLPNRLARSAAYTYNSGSEAAEGGLITSIDTGTGVITCSGGVPSTISTSTPICAVSSTPGFALLFSAVTPSAKSATTVTVSTANAALVSVGDWIALEGDSPIVQLPVEPGQILAQLVAAEALRSLGHRERAKDLEEKAGASIKNYIDSFPQRVAEQMESVDTSETLADWSDY